mmetsp:Transcript_4074/g.25586  ORF Transcript_4074/g.25586 Transcript_4074/m.25586 type:complete len:258 (+) Transcript_4074:103-876(+)
MAEESFHSAKRAACVKGTDVQRGVTTSGTRQEDVQLLQDRLDCLRIDSDTSRESNEASTARRRCKESADEGKACDTRMDGERERHLTPAWRRKHVDVGPEKKTDAASHRVSTNLMLEGYEFEHSINARDVESYLRTVLGAKSLVTVQFSDEAHALVVFDTEENAKAALKKFVDSPHKHCFQFRELQHASEASQNFPICKLVHPCARTRTSAVVARRMIAGALQMNHVTKSDVARRESKLLDEERKARFRKIQDRDPT